MNLDYLRSFVTVVEMGTMSAAARARRVSQPAITKQIQRLEQELETRLLARGPQQRVTPTDAGEQVLAFAREVLARLDDLQEQLALLHTVEHGSLALAASTIPGEYLLPGLLAAFRRRYPAVVVQAVIADTFEVARRVLAGEADVGFIGAAVEQPGLHVESVTSDEIVLAVPPSHALAGRERVPPAALGGQPLVMREEGSGTRRSLESSLAAAGHSLPGENIVLTLGSTQAVLHAVEQGLGIGFVSERAAAASRAAGRVWCVRLAGVDLLRQLYMAYLPQRLADPVVAHLVAFARAQFE